MSQYQKLDSLIIESLTEKPKFFMTLFTSNIRHESDRVSKLTGVESFRVIDRRLQALRKAGKIAYIRKTGWAPVPGQKVTA